jgi:NitT/TauT family transport system substrate-binding protein
MRELKVAYVPRITVAGLYVAEEEGFFRQAGLNVVRVVQRRNEYLVPLLTGGQIDIGFVQVTPSLINAISSGARIRIVAGRDTATGACGLIGALYGMRRTFPHGFDDLRVLKGKRVAISRPTNMEAFCLDTYLTKAGLSFADIQVVNMDQSQSVTALVEGRIDATVCNFLESRPDGVSPDIIRGPTLADIFPAMQFNFVGFGASLLEGDPRIGAAFLTALFRGAAAFSAGKQSKSLLDLLNRELGMDPQLAAQSCRSAPAQDGVIDLPSVQRLVDWTVRKGFCAQPPSIANLVDTRFVTAMNAERKGRTP